MSGHVVVEPSLRAVNLGCGVQSTTLMLMAGRGEFGDMPDVAVYSNTGWDTANTGRVFAWAKQLENSGVLPFDVVEVSAGSLREDLLAGVNSRKTGKVGFHAIPTFVDGGGQTRRQCTNEYKIQPITRYLRGRAGLARGERHKTRERNVVIEQWLGISTDEIWRAKDSTVGGFVTRYPLIEANMSRADCLAYWQEHAPAGAPQLAKSTCVGCPYQGGAQWAAKSDVELDDVAEVEAAIHLHDPAGAGKAFLHRRRIPVRAAVEADRLAIEQQPALFENECEGYCGL